jgi:hypothetical protein
MTAVFGASVDEIAFDRETMALPVLTADPALGEVLASHARTLLPRLPEDRTWTARVKRASLRTSPGRRPISRRSPSRCR